MDRPHPPAPSLPQPPAANQPQPPAASQLHAVPTIQQPAEQPTDEIPVGGTALREPSSPAREPTGGTLARDLEAIQRSTGSMVKARIMGASSNEVGR